MVYYIYLWCCCCCCVGVLRPFDTFKGHSERGQLTYPHCSWASHLGSLPVLSAHSFVSNWQLPFWNQRKGKNGRRIFFMTKSPRKNVRRTSESNPRPSAYQADAHPIELPRPAICDVTVKMRRDMIVNIILRPGRAMMLDNFQRRVQ